MLNKIIQFSIKNKLVIGIFTLFLIGYGSYEFTKLPIDAVPDITDNQVQVITITPALGAPDVERLISFPIEQVNSNIPGLKNIRSFSRFGLSVVTIVFDDDVDIYWARQQVTERLQQAQEQIPKGFGTPTLAPVTTGLGEIYQYSVRAKKGYENKYDAMKLRTIQDWIVRRQLLGVKGVADVSSLGGYLKQYEIAVDPAKLLANNITINDIFTALENNNQNTGGAYIEKGPTVLFIRSEGLVGTFDDIKNIVVKNLPNGTPLLIGNVADVRLGSATRYGAMTYNGKGEVSGAVVMMLKGANSNEVIERIKERIVLIQKTLPEGVVIDAFLDRTKMVNSAIGTVETNLMEAILIVLFVLVLFLGNFRAGFLIASVIPLSMLFAVIMMNLFGVSGNLMSLGALDFGLIVDGAVILVEAVMHRLTHSKHFVSINKLSQPEMDGEVGTSVSRIMNSAVFGQIIILIVYLPIFALEGIEGKMFKPMAQTVVFALLGAFILSLTYVPMMSALFLSKKIAHKKTFSDRIMNRLDRIYQHTLDKVLNFPKTIIASAVLLFLIAIFVMTKLGGEFIPSLEEGDFAVETRVLTGSNLTTSMNAVSTGARILLEKFPEVEKIVGKTGSSEIPTDPMPIEATDMMIILKDKSEWTSAKTFPELTEKMSKALEDVPGVTFGFQYPVQMRFNELMTGARQDVVCKIFGENLDTLARYGKKLGDISNTVQGARDLYVEAVTGMPQIVIQYNRSAIAQYGLNISDINNVLNTAFAGQSSGLVYEEEKRFDLVVRLSGEQRKNLQDVQNLLIPTPNGTQIPLNAVAKVEITEGPNQIQRQDAQRRIIVGFNVSGRDVQSMVKELQEKVDKQIKLPPGYFITYGGAFENLEKAKQRLSIAVPVSLLLIFLLLYFTFNSVKQGLLVYSAIPLSAIGGIFALAVCGIPFSISAGVGFIALFGVAVLNGIILIAEFNRLKSEGVDDVKRIVIQGTKIRLRSVLMTGAVPALGFLPMAISQGAGASVQRPLATVVIGGLLIATFLTLFVLPILYIMFEKGISFGKKKINVTASVIVFFATFLFANNSSAQNPITLQSAIDTALKNNLSLRNEKLNADYLQKLKGTAWDIPQTTVSYDYGQINSAFTDNKFGITQNIKFPSVYARQKTVFNEEWKSGILNVAVKENELKKQVTEVYYELLYLQQKQKLLQHTDSIYATFLQNAEQRFSKGESNILEKTTAETQRGQIKIQLSELENDLAILKLQFKLLLNTNTDFIPSESNFKISPPVLADTSAIQQNPFIKQLEQQQQIGFAKYKLEKSKLLPNLFATYNNMSIQGNGADNIFYTSSNRFQSFQVGIGIPLFFGSQKSGIGAMKIYWQISQNNYLLGMQTMKTEYQQAVLEYNKNLQTVNYYESTANKNADVIIKTANLQFQNGDINYLEWVMLTNNAIAIQSEYLDAVKNLNQSIIKINSLTNK
ncbi:MAG: CusA/CzcA family heavy metal efflux RND transporter [Bacteroidetes bacterium]|nr:CusA/CzcA family heavy metal efflux RND transporter [Bacteroidota bacterium]